MLIAMTIYEDAVKLEVVEYGCKCLGWFDDEISALIAAGEFVLIQSAILPELRRLPELVIRCEYRPSKAGKSGEKAIRGTTIRNGASGRRVVRLPGALAKAWLR